MLSAHQYIREVAIIYILFYTAQHYANSPDNLLVAQDFRLSYWAKV